MRLSDIMSQMGLESYAEAALVIFLIVFLAIVIRVISLRDKDVDAASRIPLDDNEPTTPKKSPNPVSNDKPANGTT